MASVRIQIVVDTKEREQFRRQAEREGLSLSAWLRRSARDRLADMARRRVPGDAAELRAFFDQCDVQEAGEEPDWSEHRRVIEGSMRRGLTDT